ncbi:Dehydrogenase multihelical [Penicillium fimorum]|uniref:Dehydrogenase multihelical n=1 Tax=Penicillium fimorum TaxID=1882269 RepID=A0A9W9XZA3_9EURO|nr:Dehydrogenase multihelical [Penicillium fimorum]
MTLPTIRTVGMIGTGVIGASWTALFLAKGLKVIVTDPAPGADSKLRDYLLKYWPTIPNAEVTQDEYLNNYRFVKEIDTHLGDIDLIQENGPERLDFKRRLFAHLDANTPEHVVIASSSSGIPSSEFITECKKNPALEVVPHQGTGDVYVTAALQFYLRLVKDPVLVKKETPGFIANRLQAAVCAEAYSLVSRGVISAEDLDKTVTSGLGLRWALTGPIMTNTLGGGGDFNHFMDHLGPALKAWLDDMHRHEFDVDSRDVDVLKERVDEWTSQVNLKEVEKSRDKLLVSLIKSKTEGSA